MVDQIKGYINRTFHIKYYHGVLIYPARSPYTIIFNLFLRCNLILLGCCKRRMVENLSHTVLDEEEDDKLMLESPPLHYVVCGKTRKF